MPTVGRVPKQPGEAIRVDNDFFVRLRDGETIVGSEGTAKVKKDLRKPPLLSPGDDATAEMISSASAVDGSTVYQDLKDNGGISKVDYLVQLVAITDTGDPPHRYEVEIEINVREDEE